MESIKDLLPALQPVSGRKTNKFYVMAAEAASLTETTPQRWLREVKLHESAFTRALVGLKEAKANNPAALFTYLLKKYKNSY